MHISDKGLGALELEEGVVLRAYRDTRGIWTIGMGLTAASGVVKPVAGMVITREEANRLAREALAKSYEPEVEVAMVHDDGVRTYRPAQHEFDAGLSFHWNTGAIGRASWVKVWKQGPGDFAWQRDVIERLKLYSKSGGKVLPALEARRIREADMLLRGAYRGDTPQPVGEAWARWGLGLSDTEIAAVQDGLHRLGYHPGWNAGLVDLEVARKFQADHGLTVDGIIGRATLATLQRALDARNDATPKIVAAVTAAAGAASGVIEAIPVPHLDLAGLAATAVWLGAHVWAYRDAIAAVLSPNLPRLAAFLRSF